MIAAHRDQENLVRNRQGPVKQQQKTPGGRFQKTPGRFGRNDENAPGGLAGKAGIGNSMNGAATPMGLHSRAPLGQKTTNAKARTGQTGGVKQLLKPTTTQKPKLKTSLNFEIRNDERQRSEDDGPEPEYAPPRPKELPYESDLLPKGGLSIEGLNKQNLFRGYYQQFYNPIDENGVSRKENQLKYEMNAVIDKALKRNQRELDEFTWSADDIPEATQRLTKKPDAPEVAEMKMAKKVRGANATRQLGTVTARKAAGALSGLSVPGAAKKPLVSNRSHIPTGTRRALGAPTLAPRSSKPNLTTASSTSSTTTANTSGQVALRSTLGYKKGKSVSSNINAGEQRSQSTIPSRTKTPVFSEDESQHTPTPIRTRRSALSVSSLPRRRPEFMAIFDQDEEIEELPPLSNISLSDDEEFELQLDLDI